MYKKGERETFFCILIRQLYSFLFGIECIRLCKESWYKTSVGPGKTNFKKKIPLSQKIKSCKTNFRLAKANEFVKSLCEL